MIYYVHAIIFTLCGFDNSMVVEQKEEIPYAVDCLKQAKQIEPALAELTRKNTDTVSNVKIVCIAKERAE